MLHSKLQSQTLKGVLLSVSFRREKHGLNDPLLTAAETIPCPQISTTIAVMSPLVFVDVTNISNFAQPCYNVEHQFCLLMNWSPRVLLSALCFLILSDSGITSALKHVQALRKSLKLTPRSADDQVETSCS